MVRWVVVRVGQPKRVDLTNRTELARLGSLSDLDLPRWARGAFSGARIIIAERAWGACRAAKAHGKVLSWCTRLGLHDTSFARV